MFSHQDVQGSGRTVSLNRSPSSMNGAKQTGIGIAFGRPPVGPEVSGPYTIHKVSTDGTAYQSGLIYAGDILLKVNGVNVVDLTARQITAMILGNPSSPMTITIANPSLHTQQPLTPPSPPDALSLMTASALNVLRQHTATHCNTLQHTATHCNTTQRPQCIDATTSTSTRAHCRIPPSHLTHPVL